MPGNSVFCARTPLSASVPSHISSFITKAGNEIRNNFQLLSSGVRNVHNSSGGLFSTRFRRNGLFRIFFGKIPAKCELILPVLTDLRHATSVYNGVKLQNFFFQENTQEFAKSSTHVEFFRNMQKKTSAYPEFSRMGTKSLLLMWKFFRNMQQKTSTYSEFFRMG